MRSELEQRIVQMRLDNGQFERGAKQSLSTLDKLDSVLDALGAGRGLDKIAGVLDTLQYRFSTFGIAGASAIEHITGKVIGLAEQLMSLPLQQIIAGGSSRALNIEQARFQLAGLGVDWEKVSGSLDYAVKGAAYGLDEAAAAAAQLVASGVKLDRVNGELSEMDQALRGISGVAAMTNSSYSEIADIFIQAAATGRISGDTIARISYRGLNIAAKLAEVLEEDGTNAHYTEQQIREMASKGQISFKDFAKAMNYAFGDHAVAANETYTGSLMNMKAALSRIGADFLTPWFEGMRNIQNALRTMFDNIRKITRPFADEVFSKWVTLFSGKLVALIENLKFDGLKNLFDLLGKIDYQAIGKGIDNIYRTITNLTNAFNVLKRYKTGQLEGLNPQYFQAALNVSPKTYERLVKLVKTLRGLRNAALFAMDIVKEFGRRLKASFTGSIIGKAIDKILDLGEALDDLMMNQSWKDTAFTKIFEFLEKVGRLGGSVFSTMVEAGKLFVTVIKQIFDRVKESSAFERLANVVGWVGEKIFNASESLREWLTNLRTTIEENGLLAGAIEGLNTAFTKAGEFMTRAGTAIGDFLGRVLHLKEGETVWTKLGDIFGRVGEYLSGVFTDIREAFDNLASGKTNPIQFAIGLIGALLGFRKVQKVLWGFNRSKRAFGFLSGMFEDGVFGQLYKGLKAFNAVEWADKIQTVLGRISGALRAFADNQNAKSLLAIGGAVILLAVGLSILAAIGSDAEALGNGLFALIAIMGILIGTVAAIKAIFSRGLFTDIAKGFKGLADVFKNAVMKYMDALAFKEIAVAMIAIAAAVLVMSIAFGALVFIVSKSKPKQLLGAGAAIVLLAGILVGVLALMNKITKEAGMVDSLKFIALAASMIAMSVAIGLLSVALFAIYKMGMKDPGALLASVTILAALAAILVGVAAAFGKWAKDPRIALVAVSMLAVSASIVILVGALFMLSIVIRLFTGMNWEVIATAAAALMSVVVPLGLLAYNVPAGKLLAAAASILVVAVAVGVMAVSLALIRAVANEDAMFNFVVLLGGIVVALLALSGVSSTLMPAALAILAVSAALAVASVAMIALALATAMFSYASPDSIVYMAAALLVVATAFILISDVLQPVKVLAAAASLVVAAVAVAILGLALNTFAGIDFESLKTMAIALTAVVLAVAILSLIGPEVMIGALALAGAGAALFLAAPGLAALGDALPHIAEGLKAFRGVEFGDILKAIGGFIALLPALFALPVAMFAGEGGPASLKSLGEALPAVADGIKAFGEVRGWDIAKTFGSLATGLGSLMLANFSKVSSFATFASSLAIMKESLTGMPEDAGDLMSAVASGINDYANLPVDAVIALANSMSTAMSDGTYLKKWTNYGSNIPFGLALGIYKYAYYAQNALVGLANSLQKSFTVTLDIHSPSRVFQYLAGYIPEGIAKGIADGESSISDAMTYALGGALSAIDQYMMDNGDFMPTITPVVDLSNVTDSAAYMQQALNGSYNGYASVSSDISRSAAGNMEALRDATYNNFTPIINVYGAEGQNIEELADEVMDRMQFAFSRRPAAFG